MRNLKALITIVIVVGALWCAVKLLPPYINNYSFSNQLDDLARSATYAQNLSPQQLTDSVIQKAKENDILIGPENVEVVKSGTTVGIDVKYSVMVQLPGKTVEMKFNPTAGNKMITAK